MLNRYASLVAIASSRCNFEHLSFAQKLIEVDFVYF